MGKPDTITKEYMKNTQVFADAFNYFLYNGEQVIDPDKLHELDTTAIALPFGADGAVVPVQKYRDVQKYLTDKTDGSADYLMTAVTIFGTEIEAKINYAMPVKNMLYDGISYSSQVTQADKSYRAARKKDNSNTLKIKNASAETAVQEAAATAEAVSVPSLSPSEFLSGFTKNDRLVPVITLVIHFGAEKWDGPLSIHEMLAAKNSSLLPFIPDYKINLISPASMSAEEINRFHSSLREVLLYIKYSKDKKKLMELVSSDEHYKALDKLAAEVINVTTHSALNFNDGEENVDMCKALDDMRKEAVEDGIKCGIERGIERGTENTRLADIKNIIEFLKVSAEQAMRIIGIPESDFDKYLSKL